MFALTFSGNVGNEPEFKQTKTGALFGRMSVAVYTGKDKPPVWIDVELWEGDADHAMKKLPLKGKKVLVHCTYPPTLTAWQSKDERLGVNFNVRPARIEYLNAE